MVDNKKEPLRIVIVGGGAGGLELAVKLTRSFGKKGVITLVDHMPAHIWKPLLHEVAAGTLDAEKSQVDYYAHAIRHGYKFELGNLQGIDRQHKLIKLSPIFDEDNELLVSERNISYDRLIIAVGSKSNDFNTRGAREFCLFLDDLKQAKLFYKKKFNRLLQFHHAKHVNKKLKIVIIGAGATGIELAAELLQSFEESSYYGFSKRESCEWLDLSIIESTNRILSVVPESLAKQIADTLTRQGIHLYTNERVDQVTADGVHTLNGNFFPADISVWAAGIKGASFLKNLGLEVNKLNQLMVKPTLQTTQDENIFAIGDCSSLVDEKTGKSVPPRAQAAHQQALMLVKSLKRQLHGKTLLAYQYRDYGTVLSLGYYNTMGLIGFSKFSYRIRGRIALVAYRFLHLKHQIAIHGWWYVSVFTIANALTKRLRPHLKLY